MKVPGKKNEPRKTKKTVLNAEVGWVGSPVKNTVQKKFGVGGTFLKKEFFFL